MWLVIGAIVMTWLLWQGLVQWVETSESDAATGAMGLVWMMATGLIWALTLIVWIRG